MEYHSDRFTDYSLLFFKKNRLIALVPAHVNSSTISSHIGLTYGGLITKARTQIKTKEALFNCLLDFVRENKKSILRIKLPPKIYFSKYSSGVEYFLFKNAANLYRRDLNFVVNLQDDICINKSKLKAQRNGTFSNLVLKEEDNLEDFWNKILIPILKDNHNVAPVHSLSEIITLKENFPNNIKQFNVYHGDSIVAGMTLFITDCVVKSQYGVVNEKGKKYRALDYIYISLYEKYKALGFKYFDLGTTNENGGMDYNAGLTNYKEELGASPVNLDYYEIKL